MSGPRSTPHWVPNAARAIGPLALAHVASAVGARAQTPAARRIDSYSDNVTPPEYFGWLDVVIWDQFHEGQRVRVQARTDASPPNAFPGAAVPGVIGVRSTHLYRRRAADAAPATVDAFYVDIGARSRAEAESLGVRPGSAVTGVKSATWLGAVRFTARSSDDRTGCAALVLAMRAIAPARLTHKVVFAFTTREEIGLEGATALAAELGSSVRRVDAVDTFVASDAPLDVVDEVLALARGAGIPVQVGTTNGGNDGAEFARVGAIDVPLSWPGRYSHSPVETLDLRDLRALARLIAVLAQR